MDSTTRNVSKLYGQTLYENHAEQASSANQPTLSASANRINNRYYKDVVSFTGLSTLEKRKATGDS